MAQKGKNDVVPFAVKRMAFDVDSVEKIVGDGNALAVNAVVENARDGQPAVVRGRTDETDDGSQVDEGLAPPVGADEGKKPVLDFVPLARARRVVRDVNRHLQMVGYFLQLHLPQLHPVPVVPPAVRCHHQLRCIWVGRSPLCLPPPHYAVSRKFRRVVADTHVHESLIFSDVVYTVWCRFPILHDWKVVVYHFFRTLCRLVPDSIVFKIYNILFFLCVLISLAHALPLTLSSGRLCARTAHSCPGSCLEKTMCRFKEQLGKEDMRKLFDVFNMKLKDQGLVKRDGSIVDAIFMYAPKQSNIWEENFQIKKDEIPE